MYIDRWMNKENMAYMYRMEYYSALKKENILKYMTTWMNIEDILLRETSQSQKDKYYIIPLIWGI